MPDLTSFLLARIGEDRTYALSSHNHWTNCEAPNGEDCTCIATLGKRNRRRLAECESKRRIVEHHLAWEQTLHRQGSEDYTEGEETMYRMAMQWVIRQLLQPYSDHPQFQPEWRVE